MDNQNNVGSLPNVSTATNKRKRRSSILKIQRPPRTPFSELEFDVATPTDATKSRRVSFSRRTGVAEFVTNEATTTWKNLYEQQNKSLESSGQDSEIASVPVASSLFTQSIDQVYTEHTVFNETTNLKESHLSFTNLGLTSMTEQQHSTLFKNDLTNPMFGEVTGINMNFSEVNTIKDDEDDLDAIERDLAKPQNGVNRPFPDQNMSQYIEIDMNKTYGAISDSIVSDMSITDTIHSPKVQGNFPVEKDWVEDKENMIINPYVSPADNDNSALNKSTEKVLVFDGKKLKYADINADLDKIVNNASPVKDKSKSIIENDMSMTKALTNVCMINNDDMSMTNVVNKSMGEHITVNMSMTAAIPSTVCMIKNDNVSMEEDMSLTKIIDEVVSVMGNVTANVDMSMTKGLTNVVCLTNNISQKETDNDVADMSLSQVVNQLEAEPDIKSNLSLSSEQKSQTQVFENNDIDLSFTQCVGSSQRKTIIFDNNDKIADISITESLYNVNQNMTNKNRQTLLFDDSTGDISMTQAIPAQIIANQTQNLTANDTSFGAIRNENVLLVYQTTMNNKNMKPVPESGTSTTSADSGHASLTPVADSSAAATEIMQFPQVDNDLGLGNQYQHVTVRDSTVSDNYETTEPAKLSPSSKGDDFHASSQKINEQVVILENPQVTSHTTAAPKVISKRPAEQVESRCEEAINSISYDKMATSSCKINKERSEESHSTEVESSEQFKTNNGIPSNLSGLSMKLGKEKSRHSIGMEEDSKISALYDSNSGSNNKEISSSEPPSNADPPKQKMPLPLPPKNVIDTLLDMSNASHESGLGDRYLIASLNTSVTPKLGLVPTESLKNDIPRDNELLSHKIVNEPMTICEEIELQESEKEMEQVTNLPNTTASEFDQGGSQQANLTSPNKIDKRKTVPVSPIKSSKLRNQSSLQKTNISNRNSNMPLRRSSITSSEINQPSPRQTSRISSKITTPKTPLRQMMPKAGRVSPNAPNVPISPKTGSQMLSKTSSQVLPKTGSQMLPKTGSQMSPKFGSQTSPKSASQILPKSGSQMSNNSACPMPPKCGSQMSPTPPSHVSSISTGETSTSLVYEMVSTANSPILSLQTLQNSSKTGSSLVSTGVSPISGRSSNNSKSNSNSSNTSGRRSRISPRSGARSSLGSSSRTSPRSSGRASVRSSSRSSPSKKSCSVCEAHDQMHEDAVIPIIEGGTDDEEDNVEAPNKMLQHKIERSLKERSFRQELKLTLQKLKDKTDHVTPLFGNLLDKVLPQQPRISEKLPQLIPEPILASSGTKSPNDTGELLESISSLTADDKESDFAQKASVDSVKKGALKKTLADSVSTLIENDVMKSPRISLCDTVPVKLQKHVRLREEMMSNPETDDSKSELESCPLTALKKTAFGESTYVKDHKIKVIPNYLEGVTEEIKDLMDDLVKPLADVMPPFQTGGGHAPLKARASYGKSLCHSASIQADLMPSSQIDLSLLSESSSRTCVTNLTGGESIYSMISTSREPSEYRPGNMVHQRQADTNFILPFDGSNPVNNIFLGPAAGHVHKYSPIHSVVSSLTSKTSSAQSSDEETNKLSNDVDLNRKDIDVERVEVSFQLSRREVPTVPEAVHYAEKSVLVNLIPESNTSRVESSFNTISIDGCTAASVTELKDAEINTAIVMKPYKQLLEVSSSLTLVDSINGIDVPPSKKESEEFHDSRTGDEDKSVYEDATPTVTPTVPDIVLKKRSRSPLTPKKMISTISSYLKSPMSKTIKTEEENDQNKSSEKIGKKEKPKKKPLYAPGVYDTQRQLDPYWMPKTSKLHKIPKNRKFTVQNLFTEPFNVNDKMNYTPSADKMTEISSIDARESFTSSKDMDDRDVISEGPMDANWVFAHELAEYGDKYNVVAKIDMLPFVGTNLCLWDSSSQSEGDNWSFILMNGQIRLLVRLEYKSDNATRTRVSASTRVIGVCAERTLQNIANSIHVLATKLAVESMSGICGEKWPVAGTIPELIRRCVVVASRANMWAMVMNEAQLRLGYKVNSKAQVKLQIANVPLASVWVVSFNITVAKGVQELFPRAENVTVHDVYTRFPISLAETRRLLADVKEDWGHVPNTLWKIFRYIKNRNKGDIEIA